MIEQIINLSCKSFKNYTTPPNFFNKKNILFGYNGMGKSSLALGIVNSYVAKGGTENSYRLFNRDYVKNNLLLKDDISLIKGVKVTFSKNDAEIAKKIQELEQEKINIETLTSNIDEENRILRNKIDNIHDQTKGKAKINKKRGDLPNTDVIDAYKADLERAHTINPSDEQIKSFIPDSVELEKKKSFIEDLKLPNLAIKKLSNEDKEFLNKILKKSYNFGDDIPSQEEMKWLDDGINLHGDSDKKCKFCQSCFNIYDVISRVKKYKENEKQKDIKHLFDVKNIIKENLSLIEQQRTFSTNLSQIGIEPKIMDNIYNSDFMLEVRELVDTIGNKIDNMSYMFDTTDCISTFENKIEQIHEKITEAHKKTIKDIDNTINNIEALTKGKIALALQDSDIQKNLGKIRKLEREILKASEDNKKIDKKIRELKEGQSEYIDFMNYLNDVLESLGVHIKLILSEKNYYLKHSIEESELTINDISEGEKNLLSLLYFYFELYTDKQQKKLNEDIELIVVDDPISSLDDANKFYVLEIIKNMLDTCEPQIFVLTHSWDDFCQITYNYRRSDQSVKLFEIYKDSTKNFQSEIRDCHKNVSPYKKLFSELYELSNKNLNELNDCDVYHAANSMRRVFEEFLNFKKPNLLPQRSSQDQILGIYKNATGRQMSKKDSIKLGSFLTFINVLSHRSIKSAEILDNCKFLLKIIKEMDKVHYDSMKC